MFKHTRKLKQKKTVQELNKFKQCPFASIARPHFKERSALARCAPE